MHLVAEYAVAYFHYFLTLSNYLTNQQMAGKKVMSSNSNNEK